MFEKSEPFFFEKIRLLRRHAWEENITVRRLSARGTATYWEKETSGEREIYISISKWTITTIWKKNNHLVIYLLSVISLFHTLSLFDSDLNYNITYELVMILSPILFPYFFFFIYIWIYLNVLVVIVGMSFQSEIREKPWWEENESQCIKYLKENTEVTIPYK